MKEQTSYGNLTFAERTEWLEDNLETGMYVRSYKGIDRFNYKLKRENQNFYWYYFEKKELTNPGAYVEKEPSYDIIDLIEVGDYVNGLRIDHISEPDKYRKVRIAYHYSEYGNDDVSFVNSEIESIVTKEQFESIKYEVKDD